MYTHIAQLPESSDTEQNEMIKTAKEKLRHGGSYTVKNSDFLTGANISVCLTEEFMDAVKKDDWYALRFQISIIIPKKKWRNTMQSGQKSEMCESGEPPVIK